MIQALTEGRTFHCRREGSRLLADAFRPTETKASAHEESLMHEARGPFDPPTVMGSAQRLSRDCGRTSGTITQLLQRRACHRVPTARLGLHSRCGHTDVLASSEHPSHVNPKLVHNHRADAPPQVRRGPVPRGLNHAGSVTWGPRCGDPPPGPAGRGLLADARLGQEPTGRRRARRAVAEGGEIREPTL